MLGFTIGIMSGFLQWKRGDVPKSQTFYSVFVEV